MKHSISTLVAMLFLQLHVSAQVFTVPYFDDFETGAPGWVADSTGTPANSLWELGTPNFGVTNTTHSGTVCWDTNLNDPYGNSSNGFLTSPEFNFSNATGILISFWQNRNVEANFDGFRLEYSLDSSFVWNLLGAMNSPGSSNWYNDNGIFSTQLPAWTGNSNGWIQSSIILPNFTGTSNVRFRFVFTADASVTFDGVSIDDFSVDGVAINVISGTVYTDLNTNGTIDTSDTPFVNVPVACSFNNGTFYQTTNSNGDYYFVADSGVAYTIESLNPIYTTIQPGTIPVSFNGNNLSSTNNNFLVTIIPEITEVRATIWGWGVRPGFDHHSFIHYSNNGTATNGGVIRVNYDTSFTPVSASEPFTSAGPNSIEFQYTNLLPGEVRAINCTFFVDSTLAVGAITSSNVFISPVTNDTIPPNNYDTLNIVATNSFDPNEKLVYPEGDLTTAQILNGQDLSYTINFQNTGTATAFHVNIYDQLDGDLDLNTFEITGNSHPVTSWSIDANRLLHFSFANINLPDSGANEQASHGYIEYKIRPLPFLLAGSVITNEAAIYFDNNLPVITNTTSSIIIDPTGIPAVGNHDQMLLYPNPNSGNFYLKASAEYNSYQVFNSIGQQIVSQKITTPGQLQQIALNKLPHGIYMVVLSGTNKTVSSRMIIE